MVTVPACGGIVAGIVPAGATGMFVPNGDAASGRTGAGKQQAYSAHAEVAGSDERTDSSSAERCNRGERTGHDGRDSGRGTGRTSAGSATQRTGASERGKDRGCAGR